MQIDGKKLIQISHNKWTATNQVHYYGWLGVRCQATTNLVLTEGEIFLYDGHRFVSDFEIAENCATQDGKCITNTSTRRTNNKKMSYSEVGIFKAQMYENHTNYKHHSSSVRKKKHLEVKIAISPIPV
ncbi:unnamed protein product [Brugia timori]|uniref:VWFD domain-containing protein n=1 Tax=Brugia timori TaxID=42155 RepID=A0A0R3R8J5_9BILA|nr:unnamed protein product [Brugia timori]